MSIDTSHDSPTAPARPPGRPCGRQEWTDLLDRVRLGDLPTDQRLFRGPHEIKAVGLRLALHADLSGAGACPGTARLAVELEEDVELVVDALDVLEQLGLIVAQPHTPEEVGHERWDLWYPTEPPQQLRIWTPAELTRAAYTIATDLKN